MKRWWSVLTRFSIFPEASTWSSGNHSILSRWLLAALAVTTFHRNLYQAWKSESEKNFFFRALSCRWQLSAWIYAKPGKGNSQMWKWKWKVKWILSYGSGLPVTTFQVNLCKTWKGQLSNDRCCWTWPLEYLSRLMSVSPEGWPLSGPAVTLLAKTFCFFGPFFSQGVPPHNDTLQQTM